MTRRVVEFNNEQTKNFVANHKTGGDYKATIQNNTGQSITITVTNGDIQSSGNVFDDPASGILTIASGKLGMLDEPYDGWLITAALATSGTVDIVEAG